MQSSLTVTSYRPTFGFKTAEKFINVAKQHSKDTLKSTLDDSVITKQNQLISWGYDNYTIDYKVTSAPKGKKYHTLFAYCSDEKNPKHIILAQKNKFRQIIGEYLNLSKDDLYKKIGVLKNR